jgi:energy-coupling factor transporter transmembrane protein EcfT
MDSVNEQHQLYENARRRVLQKKRLYIHFVIFLIGSVFFIVLNKVFNVGESFLRDWFVWAILLWFFIWILHFVNVFFFNRFMDKDWERRHTEKLVKKQELRIATLEKKIAAELKKKDHPSHNREE